MDNELLPVREIRIGLQDDDDQWITVSLHRNNWWTFRWERCGDEEPCEFVLDDMPMEALEILRDFLNYAVPNAKVS